MNFEVWQEQQKAKVYQPKVDVPEKRRFEKNKEVSYFEPKPVIVKKKKVSNKKKAKAPKKSKFKIKSKELDTRPKKGMTIVHLSSDALKEATKIRINITNVDTTEAKNPLYFVGRKISEYTIAANLTVAYAVIKLRTLGFDGCTGDTVLGAEHISALHPEVSKQLTRLKEAARPGNIVRREHDYIFELQAEDLFFDRKLKSILVDNLVIHTYFTDLEAFSICGGLKSSLAKHLSKKFFSKVPLDRFDYRDAHMYSMKALETYGSKMLSYCLSLPPLPHSNANILKAFKLLGNLKKGNPSLSFLLPTGADTTNYERYYMVFGLKEIEFSSNREVIHLKKFKTGEVLATLNSDGTITPSNNQNFYKSQLELFMTFLNSPLEAIITFGAKTGTCAVCGKDLTTHESAIRGIGPVCAKNLGL